MEAIFKQILDAIDACVMVVDLEGKVMYWSKGAERIFGYKAEEMMGKRPSKIYPGEGVMEVQTAVDKLADQDEEKEWKGIRKDGSEVWVKVKTTRLYHEDGAIRGIAGVSRDITKEKLTRQQLSQSEDRYKTLVDNAPVGIVVHRNKKVLMANQSVADMFGFKSANDLEGKNIFQLQSSVDEATLEKRIASLKENEVIPPYTYRFERLDGVNIWVDARGTSIIFEGKRAIQSILIDVTQVIENELHLKEINERFENLAETLPGILFQIESDNGRLELFLFGKDNVEDILGVPKDLYYGYYDEIVERAVAWGILHENEAKDLMDKTQYSLETGLPFHINLTIKDKNEKERYLKVMGVKQDFEIKGKNTFNGLAIDITKQKKAENELRELNSKLRKLTDYQNEIREEEKRRISLEIHDYLGQELTGIKLSLHSTKRQIEKLPIEKEQKEELHERIKDLIKKTSSSLQSARNLAYHLHPSVLDLGLDEAIGWLCEEMSSDSLKINFKSTIDAENIGDVIQNSYFRLAQAGVSNIVKHSGASEAWVRLTENEKDIILQIQDNGVGFTYNSKSRRGKLGMLGMEERINILGGKMEVESEEGFGTRLTFRAPKNGK